MAKRRTATYGLTVGARVDLLATRVTELAGAVAQMQQGVLDIMGGKSGGCPRCLRMSQEVDRLYKQNQQLIADQKEWRTLLVEARATRKKAKR